MSAAVPPCAGAVGDVEAGITPPPAATISPRVASAPARSGHSERRCEAVLCQAASNRAADLLRTGDQDSAVHDAGPEGLLSTAEASCG